MATNDLDVVINGLVESQGLLATSDPVENAEILTKLSNISLEKDKLALRNTELEIEKRKLDAADKREKFANAIKIAGVITTGLAIAGSFIINAAGRPTADLLKDAQRVFPKNIN